MSTSLPPTLERWLGLDAGGGEGTAWRLEHTWNLPAWATLLIVLALAGFVAWNYLREHRTASPRVRIVLASLRLGALGVILIMLAQFVLSLQRTGLPYLVVLLDDSQSMSVADRYDEASQQAIQARLREAGLDETSRWSLAKTLLTERDGDLLARLADRYKLRVYTVSGATSFDATHPDELADAIRAVEPKAETTRLGGAIRDLLDDLRGSVPAAVLVLTDGINTEGPGLFDAATYARRRGVPLYFVGLGDDRPVRDVKVSDLLVDDVAFINDPMHFEVRVAATGFEGRKVNVVLRQRGRREVLAETAISLGPDGRSQSVRIPYRPTEEGEFRYVVEIDPLEGELQADNNRQERTVRVRKEKIRVLLIDSEPRYEYRYLQAMFQREPTIELKCVLQNADLEHADQDASVLRGPPVRREDVFRYDVIILGDANPAMLGRPTMQHLADFVNRPGRGGAVVCIAGPKFMPGAFRGTPIAKLFPFDLDAVRMPDASQVRDEGFRVQPTELGLGAPSMQLGDSPSETADVWKRLPELFWSLELHDLKPARVLAERKTPDGRAYPLFLMHHVGTGKVLFHAVDETWRWRFRAGDSYFGRYWSQTVRYLARSKPDESETAATVAVDRREYRRGDPVRLRVRFAEERLTPADDEVTVVLESPGRGDQRLRLRRTGDRNDFEGTTAAASVGAYRAWLAIPTVPGATPATEFTVAAPSGEYERIRPDIREMRHAAETTKGRFYSFPESDRLLDELPEGRYIPVEALPPRPLWNAAPLLLLLFILLIAEWVVRKRNGLV